VDKYSATVARGYLSRVIARFEGCESVLTDQGKGGPGGLPGAAKRAGDAASPLSALQPSDQQPGGEAGEHCECLTPKVRGEYAPQDWDLHLRWLLMGYRFSTQHVLGVVSPYKMLFGKRALLPLRARRLPGCDALPCHGTGMTQLHGHRPSAGGQSSISSCCQQQRSTCTLLRTEISADMPAEPMTALGHHGSAAHTRKGTLCT